MIYALLIGHFVADFIFQSDWMALNKSKRWDALAIHVTAYMLGLVVVVGIWTRGVTVRPDYLLMWLVTNASAHFAQDAITSRWTSRLWFFQREDGIWSQAEYAVPKHGRTIVNPWMPIDGRRHWFFVVIGLDQLLHYLMLFATSSWWLTPAV